MCCGQKRLALRSHSIPAIPSNPIRPQATQSASRPVSPGSARISVPAPRTAAPVQYLSTPATLQYLKSSPIRVRGLVSGRHYEFSNSRPSQSVDRRDLPGLLRTGLFCQSSPF